MGLDVFVNSHGLYWYTIHSHLTQNISLTALAGPSNGRDEAADVFPGSCKLFHKKFKLKDTLAFDSFILEARFTALPESRKFTANTTRLRLGFRAGSAPRPRSGQNLGWVAYSIHNT